MPKDFGLTHVSDIIRDACKLASEWKVCCSCVAKGRIMPVNKGYEPAEAKVFSLDALLECNHRVLVHSVVTRPDFRHATNSQLQNWVTGPLLPEERCGLAAKDVAHSQVTVSPPKFRVADNSGLNGRGGRYRSEKSEVLLPLLLIRNC